MGRGRKEAINQSAKKINKAGNAKTKHDNILWLGEKKPNPAKKKGCLFTRRCFERIETDEPREAANVLINM